MNGIATYIERRDRLVLTGSRWSTLPLSSQSVKHFTWFNPEMH
jgi:hypothetical protein